VLQLPTITVYFLEKWNKERRYDTYQTSHDSSNNDGSMVHVFAEGIVFGYFLLEGLHPFGSIGGGGFKPT
jgi:hypothetical protein